MGATSPQQTRKPQHLHEPFCRAGRGQEPADGPAWGPKLERASRLLQRTMQDGDAQLGRGKKAGRRQAAGTGELGEDLTNEAGGTIESCFARRGQIRPWHGSAPATSICLCNNPAPAAQGGTGCAGLACQPGGPDARTAPDAGHILSAARPRGVTRGPACTCATLSRPAINSRRQRSDAVRLTAPFPSAVIN